MSRFLSLIIPMYKVEQYLCRCLDSCLSQDIAYSDYELIIINDGSPDGCLSIAKDYQSRYDNVFIIDQVNQGLSVARNNGLKMATGQYVWFIDSDDWIEKNCLGRIIKKIKEDFPDLLQIGYRIVYDNPISETESRRGLLEKTVTGKEAMMNTLVPAQAQLTLYRRDFLLSRSLMFYPGIYHEDSEFKPRVLFFAEKYSSLDYIVYNYYQRSQNSIMATFNLKRGMDIIQVADSLYSFVHEMSMTGRIKRSYYCWITLVLNQMLRGLQTLPESDAERVKDKLWEKKYLLSSMMGSAKIRHRIEGFIFRLNYNLGLLIFAGKSY